ncbi:MAG: TM0996/MTH895 family glutaredoxin-like protein [Muribaculaceae bacterium]|nr:TM0996/MTH895 family glutaredoxin-like protein [Muribaculaceae bacterium]
MDNKESKKGFWSTLFAPKKKSCCSNIIVEDDVKPGQSCGCSGDSAEPAETTCCATDPGTKVTEVLVLGPGCAKCKETYKVVELVISENNLDVRLSKIEDITEMMKYNIMATPAVVVDGAVKIKGHVPSADEVKKVLGI